MSLIISNSLGASKSSTSCFYNKAFQFAKTIIKLLLQKLFYFIKIRKKAKVLLWTVEIDSESSRLYYEQSKHIIMNGRDLL